MILLIPILLYCLLFVGLILLFNKLILRKSELKRKKKTRKIILIIGSVLFPICLLLNFSFLFGIALDDHYNVKKGTFLWYATMDNETITDFPQIDPVGEATFNKIGGDSPSISAGWEIEYTSRMNVDNVFPTIKKYLNEKGFKLKATKETIIHTCFMEYLRKVNV